MTPTDDHLASTEAWRQARMKALRAEDGWLNLTDRIEIAPGTYSVGAGDDADLQISAGPARLGTLRLGPDGTASLDAGDGPRAFVPAGENPPRLKVGDLLLEMTALEGQHALRVRDAASPARDALTEIPHFPVDPAWRIEADWVALDAPQSVALDMVHDRKSAAVVTHEARFVHDGLPVALLATHTKGDKAMFVIRDATSGIETYGASRFVLARPEGGRITLDFNQAHNPPCAFTVHAVCPLPPRQNILPFRIEAGEKALPDHG